MKLLVGLGNPGKEYARTRHNAGALFLDFVAQKYDAGAWRNEKKFFGLTTHTTINHEKYILLLPQTFMNLSGQAVQAAAHFYQLAPEDIIVAHDDLDLTLGNFKISPKGPRTHNGLADIATRLGSDQFVHLRLGIENRGHDRHISGIDYVLMPFSDLELQTLHEVFTAAADALF